MTAKPKRLAAETPVVVTANRLTDGQVVWLGDGWVEHLAHAHVFSGEEAEAALAVGRAGEAARQVVGVYAAPVAMGAHGPTPLSMKERIRANGPSIEAVAAAVALAA